MTGDERSYNEIQKCLHMLIRHIYNTRRSRIFYIGKCV